MLQAALQDGTADRRCVFEVFARSLPGRRRYGIAAGLGRLLAMLPDFNFDDETVAFLLRRQVVDSATARWLSQYEFRGTMDAYAEGEAYFPGSPVLAVEGTFAECVVLETLVLSVLNHDSAVATAAARMVGAAAGRSCIEMGSRRTHEEAGVAAARAAYLAGFDATSNLAAGALWGVPTTGTSAHSFTLLHDDEHAAFAAQVAALGAGTTLLVDTFDVERAIRTAVEVAGPELGAIRLDSGDLASEAHRARRLLDALGATGTRIVVTGDLDERAIEGLRAAPVDGYGVGTALVSGSGEPTAGFVYKLVAREAAGGWLAVQKTSTGKHSVGGRKIAVRRRDEGVAVEECLRIDGPPAPRHGDRLLLHRVMVRGEVTAPATLEQARAHCRAAIAELPPQAHALSPGDPALDTRYET